MCTISTYICHYTLHTVLVYSLCTVGDADFGDVDIAAVGGLLKLFLVSV